MKQLPKNQYPDRRIHRVTENETAILALCHHSWKRETTAKLHMQGAIAKSPMMKWETVKLAFPDGEYSYIGIFRKEERPCKTAV